VARQKVFDAALVAPNLLLFSENDVVQIGKKVDIPNLISLLGEADPDQKFSDNSCKKDKRF
jgi:hypothetical protein